MFDDLIKILTKKCSIKNVSVVEKNNEYVVSFIPSWDEKGIYITDLTFYCSCGDVSLMYVSTTYGCGYKTIKDVESVCKKYFKKYLNWC